MREGGVLTVTYSFLKGKCFEFGMNLSLSSQLLTFVEALARK